MTGKLEEFIRKSQQNYKAVRVNGKEGYIRTSSDGIEVFLFNRYGKPPLTEVFGPFTSLHALSRHPLINTGIDR